MDKAYKIRQKVRHSDHRGIYERRRQIISVEPAQAYHRENDSELLLNLHPERQATFVFPKRYRKKQKKRSQPILIMQRF